MLRLYVLKIEIDDLHQMHGLIICLILFVHSTAKLIIAADVVIDFEWTQFHILDVQPAGQLSHSSFEAAEGFDLDHI